MLASVTLQCVSNSEASTRKPSWILLSPMSLHTVLFSNDFSMHDCGQQKERSQLSIPAHFRVFPRLLCRMLPSYHPSHLTSPSLLFTLRITDLSRASSTILSASCALKGVHQLFHLFLLLFCLLFSSLFPQSVNCLSS